MNTVDVRVPAGGLAVTVVGVPVKEAGGLSSEVATRVQILGLLAGFERGVAPEHSSLCLARKFLGLLATDLATLVGRTPETISHWETGKVPIDRGAWLLVGSLLARQEGRTLDVVATARRMAESEPGAERPEVRVPYVAGPIPAHMASAVRPAKSAAMNGAKTAKQASATKGRRVETPESQRVSGKVMPLRLPPELIAALKALAAKEGTSVNALGREALTSFLAARGVALSASHEPE